MKLKKDHEFQDSILGAESEASFTIDTDNHVIFDILRSKMYSDPIAAICRELISNSRDANRENGSGDIALIVEILHPEDLLFISDMSISFEDCGPGITPARMADVFLKYGASTKRDTNAQTGGFGLGAKTPFAYSDTFTVLTVCDHEGKRMQYVYAAMIDSSGKGKMVLMSQEESKATTGTKIIVPIASADRDRFEREVIKATLFWETKPELKQFNANLPEIKKVHNELDEEEDEQWSVWYDKNEYLGSGKHWVALIDGIAYFMTNNELNLPYSLRTPHITVINFDNGELTISANREQLQYDESTLEILKDKIKGVQEFWTERIRNYVSDSKTYIEACVKAAQLGDGIPTDTWTEKYKKMMKETPAEDLMMRSLYSWLRDANLVGENTEWKGRKLRRNLNVPNTTFSIVTMDVNGKAEYKEFNKVFGEMLDLPIVFKDTKVRDNRRNATLVKDAGKFIMVKQSGANVRLAHAERQIDFVENWGIEFVMYSTVQRDEQHKMESHTSGYQKNR